jgi:glutathione peroxidase
MQANKPKRVIIVLLLLSAVLFIYVEAVNRNSKSMTVRQKVLKAIYPALMGISKLFGDHNKEKTNTSIMPPPVSFYSLQTIANDGKEMSFEKFKGKKILLVNTASDCGYTAQYDDLQKLYEQYNNKLVIIGFPANDFKEQEKGTDEDIAKFCKINYGVSFPLAKKSSVIKSPQQNAVFEWLSNKNKNGWNNQQPTWNFSKYLVNENGVLMNYFDPSLSPLSNDVIEAIGK